MHRCKIYLGGCCWNVYYVPQAKSLLTRDHKLTRHHPKLEVCVFLTRTRNDPVFLGVSPFAESSGRCSTPSHHNVSCFSLYIHRYYTKAKEKVEQPIF